MLDAPWVETAEASEDTSQASIAGRHIWVGTSINIKLFDS